ncbi:MAG: molybdenum cofactor guanylyltransferase [Deltaproteobacteria bacterium]|nr:molybdenum cofactor guanylyltransferase [Deltaproteobacteria bacterium]
MSGRASTIAGIFIGGRSTRMGGAPKGMLPSPSGEPIVVRLAALLAGAGLDVVLVGRHEAYAELALPQIADAPGVEGPLAGLVALLEHANASTSTSAIAIACDMPFVTSALVARLLDAPPSAITAPRIDGRWQPFFARYDAARVLPVAREHAARGAFALQRLFEACHATELELSPELARDLDDWDRPEDRLVPR